MSLHFRDQRGAAFLRQRNRTESSILMYEQVDQEFPSGMIFVQAQKLSGMGWTYSLYRIGWCCFELLHGISPSSIMSLRRKNEMKKRCTAVFWSAKLIDLMQLDKVINGVSRPYCFFSIPKVDWNLSRMEILMSSCGLAYNYGQVTSRVI